MLLRKVIRIVHPDKLRQMKGASSVKLRLIAQKLFAILTEAHDTYQEVVADCS
jgi:hypothetical protein